MLSTQHRHGTFLGEFQLALVQDRELNAHPQPPFVTGYPLEDVSWVSLAGKGSVLDALRSVPDGS